MLLNFETKILFHIDSRTYVLYTVYTRVRYERDVLHYLHFCGFGFCLQNVTTIFQAISNILQIFVQLLIHNYVKNLSSFHWIS